MAGQYRFKDSNGNIVAQISASVEGAIAFSGSVVDFTQANNVILGNVQLAGTASNALLLDGFDSQAFAFTSSIHPFTASIAGTNTFTSSASTRLNSIETITASNISRLNSLEIRTGSLATTGSNVFIGTQTITGSLFISSDLVVQGSSSLQNITASAVSIGTNIVSLNTANPAIRYAGLVIGDSGSVGGSGSFLYDSVQDEMLFIHRGDSAVVTSSVALMGPETYDNVGNEIYLTTNRLPKGTGKEHLVDSCIQDVNGVVTIGGTICTSGVICAPSFVGGTFTGTSMTVSTDCSGVIVDVAGRHGLMKYVNYSTGLIGSCSGTDGNISTWLGRFAGTITTPTAVYQDLVIRNNGSVGIGTTSVSSTYGTLTIAGTGLSIADDGNAKLQIGRFSSTACNAYIKMGANACSLRITNNTDLADLMVIEKGGNVGIATILPTARLHIKASSSDQILRFEQQNDITSQYYFNIDSTTNGALSLVTNYLGGNVVGFSQNRSGNVGIAHTSPVDTLDVMGALRIRCNTPGFTNACNNLVIDFVPTAVFGSNPMARYYAIGCTGVSAGHMFMVGTPTAPVNNALTIFGDGKVGVNTDNCATGTVGNGLILRSSSSNIGQTVMVIQDYRRCNKWAINGQTGANDATLTIYSTPNNTNDYTPVFSITQNGQIQRPCSAAFHATINANTNITTGGNTIQFNCVLYNAGGAYNGTNSIFTAPVSGLYQFNFVFLNQNTQNTTGGHSFLSTNFGVGTYYFQRYGCNSGLSSTGYGGYVPMHGSIAVYLPAGCSACVRAFWDADGAFTHNSTAWASFSGYLVG